MARAGGARRPRLRTAALAVLLLCAAAPGAAAPDAAAPDASVVALDDVRRAEVVDTGRLPVRVYDDRDGLPQNAVRATSIDASGYLWVGTKDGAAFYDGREWATVRLPDSKTTDVAALACTEDGSVWLGTEGGGLARWRSGRLELVGDLPSDKVRALLPSADGPRGLWVGTDAGLVRLGLDDRWEVAERTVVDLGDGLANAVSALRETTGDDGVRTLLVGTYRGLFALRDGRAAPFACPEALATYRVNDVLEDVAPDGVRSLYFAADRGLFRLRGGRWDQTGGVFVRCLARTVSPRGERAIWAGTSGRGLLRVTDGRVVQYTSANGLPDDVVASLLAVPRAGGGATLWAGTAGRGLARIAVGAWTGFDAVLGVQTPSTYALLSSRSPALPETFWVGTATGLARFRDGAWRQFTAGGAATRIFVVALAETTLDDGRPGLWVATDWGVLLFDDDGRAVKSYARELPDMLTSCLLETTDEAGERELWVGTRRGLARLSRGAWTTYAAPGAGPNDWVTCLLETRSRGARTLWVGTQSGLRRFEDGRLSEPVAGLPNRYVKCLHASELPGGGLRLWVGTNGGGACRRDLDDEAGAWRTLSTATTPALPNDVVYGIVEAGGALYMTTNRGVARLDEAGAEVSVFTADDGLPANECNTGAAYVDAGGRVWVGTTGGAAALDPAERAADRDAGPLRVERLRVGGEPVSDWSGGLGALPYDRNTFEFEFALLSFEHEAGTRYRTQLVGLEPEPTDWSPDGARRYTTLPAGDYRFRVWGRDYAGNVSGPVEVAFRIRPAPWKTWWAYAAYAALLVGAGLGAQRLRIRRLLARQRELDALVAERTESLEASVLEVRELNEALRVANLKERERALEATSNAQQAQLQMLRYQLNPHFLFNALNSIRALVTRDPARSRRMVTELSDLLRYSLSTSDAASVPLGQEVESVRSYLAIQRIRFDDRLEVRFDVEPEAESQPVPVFLLQPLVENAVKYGYLTSPEPLVVVVSARRAGDAVEIEVSNTGRWVEASERTEETAGTGIGLDNVRERLRELFGDDGELTFDAADGWVRARVRVGAGDGAPARPRPRGRG